MINLELANVINQELIQKEEELKELSETVIFEKYTQKSDGIYIEKDGVSVKIANIKVTSVKLYFDELDIFDAKIDWTYYNMISKREKTLKMASKEEIELHMKKDIAFKSSQSILPFIESVVHSGWEKIEIERGVFVEGFFYHDGKVVDNSEYRNLEYSPNDVKEAIELVNDIISNRGTARINDATVMRFMLWSPFSYCLKQIGFFDANYALILYGYPQTSKTGGVANYSWFYSEPNSTDKAVSTMPVYARRISESTFPSLIDESAVFISNKDNIDPIKRNILSMTLRGVMSRNNDGIDEPPALSLPIFTYNEWVKLPKHFERRFMILRYDKTMQVSDGDKFEFIEKYNPKAKNSPLKKFCVLGCEFKKRIIPLIETQDKRLMRIESCTMEIMEEIESDVSKELNENIKFDPIFYEIQESNTDTIKNLEYEVKMKLNEYFRNLHPKTKYLKDDFVDCANNGEIPFLFKYRPFIDSENKNDKFFIHKNDFVRTVSEIVGEPLDFEEIIEILGLDKPKDSSKIFTINGKGRRGFLISGVDVEYKIFGIKTHDRDDGEYEDDDWTY